MTSLTRLNNKIAETSGRAEARWKKLTQLLGSHYRNTSGNTVFRVMAVVFCVGIISERLHYRENKSGKIARKTADFFLGKIIFSIAALSTSSAVMLRSIARKALITPPLKKP